MTVRGLQAAIVGCVALGVADLVLIAGWLAPAAYPGLEGEPRSPSSVASRSASSTPKRPTPKGPTPKGPTPKRPTPKAPAPKGPAPKAPAPKAPAPKAPAPKAPAPKAPTPVPAPSAPTASNTHDVTLGQIYFQTGSYSLDEQANKMLRALLEKLRVLPRGSVVELRGHADVRGEADFNRRLSRLRAINVRLYLRRFSATDHLRFRIRHLGSRDASQDPRRWARDRRVHVVHERGSN